MAPGLRARVEYDAQPALGEDEQTENWVALRTNKFSGDAAHCWRLDLDFTGLQSPI